MYRTKNTTQVWNDTRLSKWMNFVYLTGRYGIFNVEVETKIDHVENAMPS